VSKGWEGTESLNFPIRVERGKDRDLSPFRPLWHLTHWLTACRGSSGSAPADQFAAAQPVAAVCLHAVAARAAPHDVAAGVA
jgi:hypothetical protein